MLRQQNSKSLCRSTMIKGSAMRTHRRVFSRALLSAVLSLTTLTPTISAQTQASQAQVDPIIGTCELDPGATQISPDFPFPAPSQRTEVYRQTDSGQIELMVSTGSRTGTPAVSNLSFSTRGGIVSQEGGTSPQTLIETRVSPGEWLVTYLANGVQVMTMRKVVSSDGRTMRQAYTVVTPRGASVQGTLVFKRQ